MIVVTGAAGFIGSCLAHYLCKNSNSKLVLVDDFTKSEKVKNFQEIDAIRIQRDVFCEWLKNNHTEVSFIFHLGARTDTTLFDRAIFDTLNLNYSKRLWELSSEYKIPFVYASSAATYGCGNHGYKDAHDVVEHLKPLNPYGASKNDFDKWVLQQPKTPPFWAGLKFFNVFGPNEYHKGRMASVVFHAFNQIKTNGFLELFKSHRLDFKDGQQQRDFVYVKDVVAVCNFLHENKNKSGIYNLGTGSARSFLDLAKAVFKAMEMHPDIRFIDTPIDIRDKYQYFTEAEMGKLKAIGYTTSFQSLEDSVNDYVVNYLMKNAYF